MVKKLAEEVVTEIVRHAFFALLALLVIITSVLAKPKKAILGTYFPAPLGARLIAWGSIGVWIMLALAALDVGWRPIAALFALAPLYTLWRWPENITIDELAIHQSAWCRGHVSINWTDVKAIELSKSGDCILLRGHNGETIGVSASQVGVETLRAEISRHTGIPCPAWSESVDGA
jgi:hypothetical protein